MGETVIEKIIRNNVGHAVKPGDIVTVNVDRVMIHDIFIPFVAEKFEEMGFKKLWNPDKVVLIYDHLVPASQLDDTRHFHVGDAFAEKYGMKNVHRSDGICHQLMTEAGYVKPGNIVNGVTDKVDDLEKVDVDALDDSKAVSISTTTDTQGIYDKIKDFLTSYNNIINKMTKLYNADSAKNYEPLTDDEKSQMSDSEVEKWETKIKDSLLRRDSNLSTIMNAMTTSMTKAISINGKNFSLSSFGISTLGYMNAAENEQNAYHIDGDEDDENTSGNKDKLMAALSSDPDTVIDFMKQLSTNLYTAIDKQMQSNSLRSRYSIYNDKEMTSQYTSYTKTIAEWETKISDKEDYYYKKFSKMETALSKLNSQTSSLSGMFSS